MITKAKAIKKPNYWGSGDMSGVSINPIDLKPLQMWMDLASMVCRPLAPLFMATSASIDLTEGNYGSAALGALPMGKVLKVGKKALKPLGLGSTGRTAAKNLVEEMAMKDALKNPQLGKVLENMKPLSDSRWKGWLKMEYKVKTQNGINAVIHYVGKYENGVLKAVDDFKFK